MTKRTRLSVVMPVYNAEQYLEAALASVFAQTVSDFELVVVEDGSSDSTVDILNRCSDPRLRVVVNEKNVGVTESLNRGLAAATGSIIARHDADDLSHPERFAKQLALLDEQPDVAAVGSASELIDANDQHITNWQYPETTAECRWRAMFNSPVSHPAAMFRRDAALDAGGYSDDHPHAEDYDLWCRLLQAGHNLANLPDRLIRYRVHAQAVSTTKQRAQEETRCRIAIAQARTVSSDIPEDLFRRIIGLDKLTPETARPALQLLAGLRRDFYATQQLTREEMSRIDNLVVLRATDVFQSVPLGARLRFLISHRELIPASYYLTGGVLRMIVSSSVKDRVKRQLGIPIDRVCRDTTDVPEEATEPSHPTAAVAHDELCKSPTNIA